MVCRVQARLLVTVACSTSILHGFAEPALPQGEVCHAANTEGCEPAAGGNMGAVGQRGARGGTALAGENVLLQMGGRVSVRSSTRQQQGAELAAGEGRVGRDSVHVSGRQLIVGGQPFHIKGVNWNPVAQGQRSPKGLDFRGFVHQDSLLMQQAGINVIRTYEPLTDRSVLDTLWSRGIRVANTVYVYGGDDPWVVSSAVSAVKDHPAILMWVLGNEWNYNMLYMESLGFHDALARIRQACDIVKQLDGSHPVATVYGGMPAPHVVRDLPNIDLWGINAYNGLSFGAIFDSWAGLSPKPLFLGEFGADAYDSMRGGVNEEAQALATTKLTNEILAHSSVLHPQDVCAGGFLFEFADEWWKDKRGDDSLHDVGGVAPGGGPYPDMTFNEEYWGIVHLDRRPRPAYHAYAATVLPNSAALAQVVRGAGEEDLASKDLTPGLGRIAQ